MFQEKNAKKWIQRGIQLLEDSEVKLAEKVFDLATHYCTDNTSNVKIWKALTEEKQMYGSFRNRKYSVSNLVHLNCLVLK